MNSRPSITNIAIVGPGAIGATVAARAARSASNHIVVCARSPIGRLTVEASDGILALDPEVVFLPDEPYAFNAEDAATIGGRVIGPFPGHLVTWHGTRTILGLRFIVAEMCGRGLSFMPK